MGQIELSGEAVDFRLELDALVLLHLQTCACALKLVLRTRELVLLLMKRVSSGVIVNRV